MSSPGGFELAGLGLRGRRCKQERLEVQSKDGECWPIQSRQAGKVNPNLALVRLVAQTELGRMHARTELEAMVYV